MSLDSCDCVFHGIGYNLTITVSHGGNSSSSPSSLSQFQESSYTSASSSSSSSSSTLTPEPTLFVDLEELSSSATWHGEFSASYVENITRKTGSFKRFDVLVKMLVGALQARTETVFLDLLTYADLEALRVRKAGGGSATASATASGTTPARTAATTSSSSLTINTKRYLILTYVAEFDRIHYPLPLLFEETPTVASLSRLVRRLRGEVLSFRSLAGLAAQAPALTAGGLPTSNVDALSSSVQGLQRENALLRQMLTEQQAKVNEEKESISAMKGQITSLSEMNKTAEAAIEKLRNASKAEVKRLRGEIAELQAKVAAIGGGGGGSSSAAGVTNTPSFADVDHILTQQQQSSSSSPLLDTDNNVIIQLRESNDALSKRVQELTKQLALSKGTSGSTTSSVQRGRALLATNAKGVRGGSAHNVSSSKSPAATARSPATISTASIARLALNKTAAAASSQPQRGRSSSVGSTGSVKRSNSASSATKALSSSRRTPTPVRNNTLNNSHTSVGSAGRPHSLTKSRHTVTTSSTSSSNGGVGEGISNNNITSANTTPTSISSTGGPRPGSRAYYNAKVAAARAAAAATSSSPSLRSKSGTVTPTPPTLVSGGASLESSLSALNNKALATSITSASPFGGRSANGGGVLTSKVASAQSAHSNGGGRSTSRGSAAGTGGGGKAAASLSQSPYLTSIGPMLQTLERGPAGRKSATPTPTRDFSSSISASSSLVNVGGGSGRVITSAPSLTSSSSSSSSRSTSTGKAHQQATRSSTTVGQNNENVNQNEILSGYSTVGEKQRHHQQHQEQQKPSVLSSSSSLNNNIADPPVIPRQAWISASAVETTSAPPPPPSVMSTSKASTSSSTSPGSNTNRYEASTEIQDIDARLAQLQDFLRAAKNGDPLPTL
jgi:coiled-coil domain-containing protein 61